MKSESVEVVRECTLRHRSVGSGTIHGGSLTRAEETCAMMGESAGMAGGE